MSSALSGPAHRQAAHSASATTAAGGPRPDSLASRFTAKPGSGADVVLEHPAADPAAVERDPHPGADRDGARPSSGTE